MMVVRLVGCALLLTACLESQLVPCGDNACPRGAVCVGGVCATPEQLGACAGGADDASCTLGTGAVGRCRAGVCVITGCGNRVVDPGEVCDDGNVTALDGCSGTCDSDETCGNGVLDVVRGESCDCGGDAVVQPSTCDTPNSDDPAATCTTDCRLRRCGDNAIGGAEQCDGSAPFTVACEDFGFYQGELACSSVCQFDPVGCTGRCGDGTLDLAHETCDGAPPENQACLDFGFDLGPLGCSSVCTPGLAACDRLGWSRADPALAAATEVWAGDDRVLVLFASGDVAVTDHGVRTVIAGPFTAIAGTPTALYAVGPKLAKQYSAGAWSDLAVTMPPWGAAVPASAWASATLGLFVAVPSATEVHRFLGAAWSLHAVPPYASPRFGGSATKAYLFDRGTQEHVVWRTSVAAFVPTAFVFPAAMAIYDIADSPSAVFVATGDDLYTGNATGNLWLTHGSPASRVRSNSLGGFDVLLGSSQMQRFGEGALGPIAAPPNVVALAEDRGRSYVAGSAAGVFVLNRGAWGDIPDPPLVTRFARVRPYKTGGIAVSGRYAARYTAAGWVSVSVQNDTRDSIIGASGQDPFVHVSALDGFLQYVPVSGVQSLFEMFVVNPKALWQASTNTVVAVGLGGAAVLTVGAPLKIVEMEITGADLVSVGGLGPNEVYAAGQRGGNGLIVRFDGASWTAIDTSPIVLAPLAAIHVTPAGHLYAVSGEHIYRYGPNDQTPPMMEWTDWVVPGARLTAVAGSGDRDVWFAGKAEFGFAFSGLLHWDGQARYPVRLPGGGVAHELFVEAGRIVALVTDEATNTDSIVSLARVSAW